MTNFKANYEIVNLSAGENLITGGTFVHEVYAISAANVTIVADGGGEATFVLQANDKVNVVTRKITVNSGTAIGFRTNNPNNGLIL